LTAENHKMPWGWSLFKQTANVNLKPGQDVQTSNELSYRPNEGWEVSSETEVNAVNIGADVRQETVKFQAENDTGSVTVAGPSAGAEVGFKSNQNRTGLSAMAELSAARAEGTLNITENAAVYGSANLNANTGAKIGTDGVEVNVLGFGLTLGVGGKWTFNTPVGSLGGCSPMTNTNTNTSTHRTTSRRTHENVYTN
jgi:hypothetical protein